MDGDLQVFYHSKELSLCESQKLLEYEGEDHESIEILQVYTGYRLVNLQR